MTGGVTGAGRPLRFLAMLTVGWVGMRGLLLWPADTPAAVPLFASFIAPMPAAAAAYAGPARAGASLTISLDGPAPISQPAARYRAAIGPATIVAASASGAATAVATETAAPPPAVQGNPTGSMATVKRLAISGWAIVRGDGGGGGAASLAGGGQLGGSQVGVRAAFALDRAGRTRLFGRLSAPLATRSGREAAIGLDWQPLRGVPVRIAAERRQSLGGGRDAFALGLFGGVDSVALAGGFVLDGYGQAGVVGLRRRDGYVDAAVRVERPLVTAGRVKIAVGAGAWGGAQPHIRRLDIGPQLVARVPAAGTTLRLGIDWRQRIAGNARPGSGPALSLGSDF